MIAHINNEYASGAKGTPEYYEFSVTTPDHQLIASRKIRVSGKPLNFRTRNADDWIIWKEDSSSVKFMDGDKELWREDFSLIK
jgi:hypothetical protein